MARRRALTLRGLRPRQRRQRRRCRGRPRSPPECSRRACSVPKVRGDLAVARPRKVGRTAVAEAPAVEPVPAAPAGARSKVARAPTSPVLRASVAEAYDQILKAEAAPGAEAWGRR